MRRALAGVALAIAALPVCPQHDHAAVAVPFYRAAQAMAGLHAHWTVPRALTFEREARTLTQTTRIWCAGPAAASIEPARAAWRAATAAWEALATPAIGPVVERRSPRRIDFAPTRPELIARAVQRAPLDAAAMERIGSPAKGLPALERMLWVRPITPGTAECAYAVQVAADVLREAAVLAADFESLAGREWTDAAGDTAFAELLNQWVGGLERLRWQQMDKPLREAASTRKAEVLPRAASGTTAASWARQWQALRALAVFAGGTAPAPGSGMVPLETYLRGRGLNALADRWVRQAERTDRAMAGLRLAERTRVTTALRELTLLKRLAEGELAPALEVAIGFSDADGD